MYSYTIPDPNVIRQEILASHERCKQYGIDPFGARNQNQIRLSPEELTARRKQNRAFLDIATTQIQELYHFVAGAGFAVTIADKNGYILEVIGDPPIVDHITEGNCCPGYRWTERDVGTSVISLVLERQIPFQVNDDEHFCERGHGFTCSASPIFDDQNTLIGVIAMSGEIEQVHPHTLGMVITAARAIERQLQILKDARELLLRNKRKIGLPEQGGSLLEEMEKQTITEILKETGHNISKSSNILGITRATLYKKLKKYDIILSKTRV